MVIMHQGASWKQTEAMVETQYQLHYLKWKGFVFFVEVLLS